MYKWSNFTGKYVLFDLQNSVTYDSLCCPPHLGCISYTFWRWPYKFRNMLQLRVVLIQCWFNNAWEIIFRRVFDTVILRHGYEQDKTSDVFAGRTQFEFVRIFTVSTAIFMFYPVLSGDLQVLSIKNESSSNLFVPLICWWFGKCTH